MSLRSWLKTNWKFFLKELVVWVVIPTAITIIGTIYGAVVVVETEALKALIQAEATIFGFFGLIVVYLLKSIDDKEDRYEQMLFDCIVEGKETEVPESEKRDFTRQYEKKRTRGDIIREIISDTRRQKHALTRFLFTVGFYLVASILLSIGALALSYALLLAGLLTIFATIIFFIAVIQLLWMFKNIAKARPRAWLR